MEGIYSSFCHLQVRFYVLYIQPSRIHQRKFDASGKEVEPNFSDTKKVNTGFLMSSYSEYTGVGSAGCAVSE